MAKYLLVIPNQSLEIIPSNDLEGVMNIWPVGTEIITMTSEEDRLYPQYTRRKLSPVVWSLYTHADITEEIRLYCLMLNIEIS